MGKVQQVKEKRRRRLRRKCKGPGPRTRIYLPRKCKDGSNGELVGGANMKVKTPAQKRRRRRGGRQDNRSKVYTPPTKVRRETMLEIQKGEVRKSARLMGLPAGEANGVEIGGGMISESEGNAGSASLEKGWVIVTEEQIPIDEQNVGTGSAGSSGDIMDWSLGDDDDGEYTVDVEDAGIVPAASVVVKDEKVVV